MVTRKRWFPAARREKYALITKTTAFTSVDANRVLIGFGTGTPNGAWFDAFYSPKLTSYNTTYQTWDNPATSTPMALANLKDAEDEFFFRFIVNFMQR